MTRFRYKHIQSTVEDKIPSDLLDGELAVNRFKGKEKIFLKNASGEVVSFSSDSLINKELENKANVSDFSAHTANTEIHVTSADKAIWNAKVDASAIANFFDDAKYEDSGETKVINFYHGNTIKATIDASDFIVDGMVEDVRIENGNLVIDFNTESGKQDISIPLTDIFDPSNYYNKTAIDNLVGSGFTSSSITDVIIENEEIVSAALTDLDERKLDASAYTPTDLTNYYTKSETSGATELTTALSNKADTATTLAGYGITDAYTKSETSGATELTTAFGEKLDASAYTELWVSGNGENAVSLKGGENTASGKLSVAEGNGTTASGDYSHAEGQGTTASGPSSHAEGSNTIASGQSSHAEGQATRAFGNQSHAEGYSTTASGDYSHAEGNNTTASGYASHAEGQGTTASNASEHASGQYNVSSSASTTFGDSGNTLFSVGNGTADNARHNAFEIRQNGDIYIVSGNTDIKLQDHIGSVETVTAITPSNSGSTDPIATKVVAENELVVSNALTDLDERKLDASAYTPTDLSNYYTKSETSGATELTTAFSAKANTATTLAGYGISDAYTKSDLTGSTTTVVVAKASSATTAASAGSVAWDNVSGKPSSFTPSAHDQASNTITAMTGYAIASASGAVATNDTLNAAIGKLEKRIALLEAALGEMKLVKLTQAQYDALTTKDSNTLYVISD